MFITTVFKKRIFLIISFFQCLYIGFAVFACITFAFMFYTKRREFQLNEIFPSFIKNLRSVCRSVKCKQNNEKMSSNLVIHRIQYSEFIQDRKASETRRNRIRIKKFIGCKISQTSTFILFVICTITSSRQGWDVRAVGHRINESSSGCGPADRDKCMCTVYWFHPAWS